MLIKSTRLLDELAWYVKQVQHSSLNLLREPESCLLLLLQESLATWWTDRLLPWYSWFASHHKAASADRSVRCYDPTTILGIYLLRERERETKNKRGFPHTNNGRKRRNTTSKQRDGANKEGPTKNLDKPCLKGLSTLCREFIKTTVSFPRMRSPRYFLVAAAGPRVARWGGDRGVPGGRGHQGYT